MNVKHFSVLPLSDPSSRHYDLKLGVEVAKPIKICESLRDLNHLDNILDFRVSKSFFILVFPRSFIFSMLSK